MDALVLVRGEGAGLLRGLRHCVVGREDHTQHGLVWECVQVAGNDDGEILPAPTIHARPSQDEATHVLEHVKALGVFEVVHGGIKVKLRRQSYNELIALQVVQQAYDCLVVLCVEALAGHCKVIKVDYFLVDEFKLLGLESNQDAVTASSTQSLANLVAHLLLQEGNVQVLMIDLLEQDEVGVRDHELLLDAGEAIWKCRADLLHLANLEVAVGEDVVAEHFELLVIGQFALHTNVLAPLCWISDHDLVPAEDPLGGHRPLFKLDFRSVRPGIPRAAIRIVFARGRLLELKLRKPGPVLGFLHLFLSLQLLIVIIRHHSLLVPTHTVPDVVIVHIGQAAKIAASEVIVIIVWLLVFAII